MLTMCLLISLVNIDKKNMKGKEKMTLKTYRGGVRLPNAVNQTAKANYITVK